MKYTKPLIMLMITLALLALFTVYTRHQHRVAYNVYLSEKIRRDALNDEWRDLLAEVGLYSFAHRIEKESRKSLSMRAPLPLEVDVIVLTEKRSEM